LGAHVELAASYIYLGRENEARAEAAEVLRIDPEFSVERFLKGHPRDQSEKDRIAENLRKAALK